MFLTYDNVDYDLGEYDEGCQPPEYGERYHTVDGWAKNGKKGKIFVNDTGALNGWKEEEVDLSSPLPAKDNDIITKSKKYMFGNRVINPITGDLLYEWFDDVPESFDDLIDKGVEYVHILPKENKEEYIRRLKNDLSSKVARREIHDRQYSIGSVLDDLSKYN